MKTLSTFLIVLTMSFTFGMTDLIAQPANDLIENAIDLGEGPFPYSEIAVDFSNATNTNDNTPSGTGCSVSQAGIWYKFTASAAGIVPAVMVNPNSSSVIYFTGPAQGVTTGQQLTHVNQGSNPCAAGSSATINTVPGTTYYLYMKNNTTSDVLINAESAFEAPENDLITNAINLGQATMPYVEENIHFLMATSTDDGGQMGCPSGTVPGIWYKITPQQDGLIQASISSEFASSALIIYESLNPDATTGIQLTWVDQPNNPCGVGNFASVDAVVGNTYYFLAASSNAYADITIDASDVLGTNENTIIEFSYYPNPVVDQLNFSAKSSIDNIKIYNLLGQQVLNQNISSNSGSVDMRHLTKGMYLAEITSGGAMATAKILKK